MQRNPKGYVDISKSSSSKTPLHSLEDSEKRSSAADSSRSLTRGSEGKGRALGAEHQTPVRTSGRSNAYFEDSNNNYSGRSSSDNFQLKRNGGEVRNSSSRTRYTPQSSRYSEASPSKSGNELAIRERGDIYKTQSGKQYPAQSRYGNSHYGDYNTRKKNSRKKSDGFKKFLIIYCIILVVVLIVGLIIFNSFIKTYENNQPTYVIASVVEELESSNARNYLENYKDQINSFEDTSTILDDYVANLNGKTLSYIANSDSGTDIYSYNITTDGQTVAVVTLEKGEEGAFGLSGWKIKSLDISAYMPTSYSYDIMVPNDDTVYVNGKEVDATYITAVDEIPEAVKNVTGFVDDIPTFDTYTVKGLLNVPTITAKKSDGSEASVAQSTDAFLVEGKPTDAFISEQSPFVEAALKNWAYHFINYGSPNLSYYVQSGSDLYAYIFGSDTMDPIYTAFYDWEYISNVTFNEFWYGNFMQYSPSCYSVDVKYQLTVDFNNGNPSDTEQELDATWIIVYNNGYWAIADLQYHNNTSSTSTTTTGTDSTTNETTTAPATTEK